MDGYAVRGDETTGANDYNPLAFRVVGKALPGIPFDGTLLPGQAVRIMTGAPLPQGADAVVPAEYARETPAGMEAWIALGAGKHVGRLGEDIARGATVLSAGRRLRVIPEATMVASHRTGAPASSAARPEATAPSE